MDSPTDRGLSHPQCGKANKNFKDRIVNGWTTEKHEYPWQVRLTSKGFQGCGGTIIHPKFIMTAAHCTNGLTTSDFKVFVGDHDVTEESLF